jgi:hypothetical protein
MSNTPSNAANSNPTAAPATAAETRQIILKEIGSKWNKFSEQELSALSVRPKTS